MNRITRRSAFKTVLTAGLALLTAPLGLIRKQENNQIDILKRGPIIGWFVACAPCGCWRAYRSFTEKDLPLTFGVNNTKPTPVSVEALFQDSLPGCSLESWLRLQRRLGHWIHQSLSHPTNLPMECELCHGGFYPGMPSCYAV